MASSTVSLMTYPWALIPVGLDPFEPRAGSRVQLCGERTPHLALTGFQPNRLGRLGLLLTTG